MQAFLFAILAFCVAASHAVPFDPANLPRGMQKLYKVRDYDTWVPELRGEASWKTCGGDKSIVVHKLSIPSPLVAPGLNRIAIDVEMKKNFDNFALDVSIKKKMGIWVPIPCIQNVGSCFYEDVCKLTTMGNGTILDQLENAGLSVCPFAQGRYSLDTTINVPALPDVDLITGKYRIKTSFYQFPADSWKKKLILCVEMDLELK